MGRRLAVLLAGTAMAVAVAGMAGMARAEAGDTTPPTVVSTVPADGRTGFDRDANIRARFSEAMMRDSIKFTTFRIFEGNYSYEDLNLENGGPDQDWMRPTMAYDARTMTATLDPAQRLSRRTTYTVWVEGEGDPDRLAVEDRAGNAMASDHLWRFRTGRR